MNGNGFKRRATADMIPMRMRERRQNRKRGQTVHHATDIRHTQARINQECIRAPQMR